jgi:putative lipoic acid-binding regulatory protein
LNKYISPEVSGTPPRLQLYSFPCDIVYKVMGKIRLKSQRTV